MTSIFQFYKNRKYRRLFKILFDIPLSIWPQELHFPLLFQWGIFFLFLFSSSFHLQQNHCYPLSSSPKFPPIIHPTLILHLISELFQHTGLLFQTLDQDPMSKDLQDFWVRKMWKKLYVVLDPCTNLSSNSAPIGLQCLSHWHHSKQHSTSLYSDSQMFVDRQIELLN